MWKETYRYIVAIVMVSTLYNIHKAHGSPSKICTPLTTLRGPHEQGFCGDMLQVMLELICTNGFNSRGKREVAKVREQLQQPLSDVTMSRADASAYLISKKTNYHDTGVVCECCYHSCSVDEIMTYCLPSNSFRKRGEHLLKRTQAIGSQEKHQQQQKFEY